MLKKILFWLVTLLVLFIVIVPLVWIYLTAFKSQTDIFSTNLQRMVVFKPTLKNFLDLFTQYPFWPNLLNTAIVSVLGTVVTMAVSLLAAYSFARWNTGGGDLLFMTVSTRMFPMAVAAIPHFIFFKVLGLLDTHWGLMLLYMFFNMSFATFLLYGFFNEVPKEVEQAAMIDGYGRMEIFRKIVFPLIKPGLAVTSVFCLIWMWNEFFFAFLFTRSTRAHRQRADLLLLGRAAGAVRPDGRRGGDHHPAHPAGRLVHAALHHPRADLRSGEGMRRLQSCRA